MKNLIIDVGNSAIKVCTGYSASFFIKKINNHSYSAHNFKTEARLFLSNYIKDLTLDRIGISVLNLEKKRFLEKFFSSVTGINPDFIDRSYSLPFKIDYGTGLGNDRICSLAGAFFRFRKPNILVIDFGTASTYTLMTNKILSGGIISPGILTSLNSLTYNTDLPEISLKFPSQLFTDNTKDNIRSGILNQALYSAEAFIKEAKNTHTGLFVAATGGLSHIISERTKLINVTDKHLVLRGINYLLQ